MTRKVVSAFVAIVVLILSFTGCSGDIKSETPVMLEQVNTEGRYAARGYLESILTGDREMFNKCYPEGFVDDLNAASGVDVFDEYAKATRINGVILGTASVGATDYTVDNGFDEAHMRARICSVMGFEYSEVGRIQVQVVRAFFKNDSESVNTDFHFVVFEKGGSWYMFESLRSEAGY